MTNIIEEVQLDYCDVMIKPKRSTLNSRNEPNIYRDYKFKWTDKIINGNGLMVANMATTGTFEMAKVMQYNKMFCCLQKHYTFEELYDFLTENNLKAKTFDEKICGNDYIFVSTGIKDGDYEKICKVLDLGLCKNLCIDIANGYIPNLITFVKKIREKYSDLVIMVGNVVTGDMVQDLILNGADIVKVGIGPGSVCLTRKQTGCGRPQFSTVVECAEAAHAVEGMICADGGITCNGDICKAYGAGADFVMCGGLFAGTDEANGDIIEKMYRTNEYGYGIYEASHEEMCGPLEEYDNLTSKGELIQDCDCFEIKEDYSAILYKSLKPKYEIKKFKQFYGMSSKLAQDKHWNGMNQYRTSEGREKLIPYTGSAQSIINDYLGSLRSYFTYCNIKKLKDAPKCTSFYKVHNQLNMIFSSQNDI